MKRGVRRAVGAVGAVGAVVAVATVAGCTARHQPADTSRPPAIVVPSPSASADPERAAILDVYAHFTTAYVAAANAGNPQAPDLVAYGAADGGGTAADIGVAAGSGVVATGTPSWSGARVTSLTAQTATVTGCFGAEDWRYVTRKTKAPADPVELNADPAPEPLRPGETPHRYVVTASMRRSTSGGWFVLYLQARPEQSC